MTVTEVRNVMTQMGMRYKKVIHIPLKANSERNLVLRQQWALKYLDILQHNKIVLTIDETWVSKYFINLISFFVLIQLGMSDFRRRKW